jgi:hypothetical protein
MSRFSESSDHCAPSDVCLLLRAHAEQRCLAREVVPVLRQLQTPAELPEEQLGAALAYLEVTWLEARRLAAETDAAFAGLNHSAAPASEQALPSQARRYHAAVRSLRDTVALRVDDLLAAPCEVSCSAQHAGLSERSGDRTFHQSASPVVDRPA